LSPALGQRRWEASSARAPQPSSAQAGKRAASGPAPGRAPQCSAGAAATAAAIPPRRPGWGRSAPTFPPCLPPSPALHRRPSTDLCSPGRRLRGWKDDAGLTLRHRHCPQPPRGNAGRPEQSASLIQRQPLALGGGECTGSTPCAPGVGEESGPGGGARRRVGGAGARALTDRERSRVPEHTAAGVSAPRFQALSPLALRSPTALPGSAAHARAASGSPTG
jgi:hypothetical protein